jgi:hypothetical protein
MLSSIPVANDALQSASGHCAAPASMFGLLKQHLNVFRKSYRTDSVQFKMIDLRIKIFLAVAVFIFSIYLEECHSLHILRPTI